MFILFSVSPCKEKMTDGGEKPVDKFTTTLTPDGKSMTVTPKEDTFGGKLVELESVTITVTNGKKFVVESIDKNGNPEKVLKTEETTLNKPDEKGEKTVKITFEEYKPSNGVRITILETSESDKPSSIAVTTIVACLPEKGNAYDLS